MRNPATVIECRAGFSAPIRPRSQAGLARSDGADDGDDLSGIYGNSRRRRSNPVLTANARKRSG